jgi:beta-mannosidase
MARRFFAPTIISAFQREDGAVEIWVTNDGLTRRPGVVTIRVMDFAGKIRHSQKVRVAVPAQGARLVKTLRVKDIAPRPEEVFLVLELHAGGTAFSNEHFFCAYKKCELPKAAVRTSVRQSGGSFLVSLATDKPAFYLSLNADGVPGEFDDNCITMLPGRSRALKFTPKKPTALAAFKRSLKIRHLRLTYA